MKEEIVITDGYTLNPGDLSWEGIHQLGNVRYYDRTAKISVAERCHGASVIVTNKTPIVRETIEQCAKLKLIAVTATGYNIVDLEAAKEHGIVVCNVPGYGTDSVAQHTFALLLEVTNHVGKNSNSVRTGDWTRSKDFSYTLDPIMELAGKTFGIVGYGEIGRKVGQIALALGMKVLYSRKSSGDKKAVSVETIFSESDVVSLHCPLTKDNEGFVNTPLLARMKAGAILINTARGQLIREEELALALRKGNLKAAALDVLSKEPPDERNPLIGLDNCIITPHTAWVSFEARSRIMRITTENIRRALAGDPHNQVW